MHYMLHHPYSSAMNYQALVSIMNIGTNHHIATHHHVNKSADAAGTRHSIISPLHNGLAWK
jgi:hypothetical protein